MPQITAIGEQIKNLASSQFTPYKTKRVDIGPVEGRTAEMIKQSIGIDVFGFNHQVDNYALRHSLQEHAHDLVPLLPDDFTKIPDILKNPDTVCLSHKTKQGLNALQYSKKYNGTIYYIEEIRTGSKTLNLKTMYKTKTPSGASLAPVKELGAVRPPHDEVTTPDDVHV